MLLDARALADGSCLECDVCIVGAGPAGLTLAHEMDGAGLRVCVVESGGPRFEPDAQELSRMASVDTDLAPAAHNRRRQLGGNAHLWRLGRRPARSAIRLLPLDEIDFARRPWIPASGWPFGRRELDPYYARAHRLLGIGAYEYSVAQVERPGARPLPLDSAVVRTSVERFGTSKPFLGDCIAAVRRSADVTILAHATAGALEEGANAGRVERLHVACLNGRKHSVAGQFFVLAAGGLENPRLLLLSRGRRAAGIGNDYDLVGRYFMDHLLVKGTFVPADPRLLEQAALYDVRAQEDGRVVGCKLNLTAATLERESLLNGALKLEAQAPPRPWHRFADTNVRLMLRHRQLRPSLDGWSALSGNARRFRDFAVYLQVELAPDPENRVLLAKDQDLFGRPLPAVRWKWDGLSRRSALRTGQLLAAAFARAGLGTLLLPQEDPPPLAHREGFNHHMGTTRMHADPAQGVVDGDCRVHGVSNLFVAGSSVFPTGGYANPTLTIVALAIRLADRLRALMRSGAARA